MSLRRLSGNAIASVLNVVASAILLFALYRFLAIELGAANIGIWSLVMAAAAAARLGDFGLGNGVVKFVASDLGGHDRRSAAGTVGLGTATIGAIMTLLCVALWFLLPSLLLSVLPDAASGDIAIGLLPWALASLWLTTVANVFIGALDGAQRTDLRAWAVTSGGLAQLLSAYWLVPQYGVAAMGPVQGIYSAVVLIATLGATVFVLREPANSWLHWPILRVRELARYGGLFQLAAIGQLAFEPAVKFLLGYFGSLALTGYFELANRAVSQLRQLVAAAYQMLVPYVAARLSQSSANRSAMVRAYERAWQLLMLTATPYFVLVGCALPWLLTVWIGTFEADFILMGMLCLAGWAANTLALPSYNLYLAVGKLRWNVLTQVAIGVLNLIFASVGGWLAGGLGVVAGAMLALALGSLVVVIAFHADYDIKGRSLLSGRSTTLLGLGVVCGWMAYQFSLLWAGKSFIPMAALSVATLYAIFAVFTAWRDPLRAELSARLRQ